MLEVPSVLPRSAVGRPALQTPPLKATRRSRRVAHSRSTRASLCCVRAPTSRATKWQMAHLPSTASPSASVAASCATSCPRPARTGCSSRTAATRPPSRWAPSTPTSRSLAPPACLAPARRRTCSRAPCAKGSVQVATTVLAPPVCHSCVQFTSTAQPARRCQRHVARAPLARRADWCRQRSARLALMASGALRALRSLARRAIMLTACRRNSASRRPSACRAPPSRRRQLKAQQTSHNAW